MQPGTFFVILHYFANIQELHVNDVHVDIFAIVLLHAELGLFERGIENVGSIVLYSISRENSVCILTTILIFELFCFIVEVLPNDIGWFLFL